MTLGNMRANGVRSLDVSCSLCHHPAMFGPRMVCACCGMVGADARPNWREQPARETLTNGCAMAVTVAKSVTPRS